MKETRREKRKEMEISQIEYANHKRLNGVISGNALQWLPKLPFLVTVELFSSSSKSFANKSNRLGGKKRILSQSVNVPPT